jgi:hypothetical protein
MIEPNTHETAPKQPDEQNDSAELGDQVKGQTAEHADPPIVYQVHEKKRHDMFVRRASVEIILLGWLELI